MPVVRWPTSEEQERANAFTAHKHYVGAIGMHLRATYGAGDAMLARLIAEQRQLPGFQRIQGGAKCTDEVLRRYLNLSWASELQLRLAAAMDSTTLRYSNAWAPVHAYYASYMALQAWFAANGFSSLVDDHTSTLRSASNLVADRGLLPAPFNVVCKGCPQAKLTEFVGAPSDCSIDEPIQILQRPTSATFWPRYGLMLRTTRERRLERNFDEWKRKRGRKAIWAKDKIAVADLLPPTTIFDFLWRLRIRANYRDVTTFLTWNVSDEEQREFVMSLITLTDALCTLIQSLVMRKVGRERYATFAAEFAGAEQRS